MASDRIHPNHEDGWHFTHIEEGSDMAAFQLGDKGVFLRRYGAEVHLAEREAESVEDLKWSRWAIKDEETPVTLQPRLPELPVLCEPDAKFSITPGARCRVFVEIPLCIAVFAGSRFLTEYKIEDLSQTWFGELAKGNLCYWISTGVQLTPPEKELAHKAIAPIQIENQSQENLEVSRICIRTEGLALYEESGHLWTNAIDLKYQGGAAASNIEIESGAPPEAKTARLVTPPQNGSATGFVAKTFRSLLEWTNLIDD